MGDLKNVVENPLGDSNFSKIVRSSILWDRVKLSKCPRNRSKMIWGTVKHSVESWDIIVDWKNISEVKVDDVYPFRWEEWSNEWFWSWKFEKSIISFISHILSDLDGLIIRKYLFKVLFWCSVIYRASHQRLQTPQRILKRVYDPSKLLTNSV